MSRFRTAALGAVLVLGVAGVASAQAPARRDSARWSRDGQVDRGRRGFGAGRGGERARFMSELNLTEAQKTRVKAIHAKYEPQLKALHEQAKAQFGDIRAAREKGDTSAATRARFQQFRERSMAIRQQEQNEIRTILTADQRAKFDAAQAQRKQRFEARKKGMQNRRGQLGKTGKA